VFFCLKHTSLVEKCRVRSRRSGGTTLKRRTVSLLIAGLALTGLSVGAVPCAAQSENWGGPQSATPPAAAAAPSAVVVPATAPPAATPSAATGPAAAAKKTKTEVLPWANQPTTPVAETPPVGDQAAIQAAAAQCSGLFEAACRDLKTCAWIADVVHQDGTRVPARCLARPPAPPKSANKAANKPKKTTATVPQAPAVKAAVTRVEDVEQGDKPAKVAPAAAKEVEAKATPPVEDAPKQQEAKQEEKPKDTATEAAQAPIVVTPPKSSSSAAPGSATMPSFGSVSPVMPGAGDGVVVSVPSGSSQ
jgi:hypothetical protein